MEKEQETKGNADLRSQIKAIKDFRRWGVIPGKQADAWIKEMPVASLERRNAIMRQIRTML